MYSYEWDKKTRGYKLTTQTGKFVACEIRPVFAEELLLLGFDEHFDFDHTEIAPLMWAKNNVYFYGGVEVARTRIQLCKAPLVEYLLPRCNLLPADIDGMLLKNKKIMDSLVANTQKRIKEMYEEARKKTISSTLLLAGGKILFFCWISVIGSYRGRFLLFFLTRRWNYQIHTKCGIEYNYCIRNESFLNSHLRKKLLRTGLFLDRHRGHWIGVVPSINPLRLSLP